MGHNLRVEGWLEARNIKDTNKGVFEGSSDISRDSLLKKKNR